MYKNLIELSQFTWRLNNNNKIKIKVKNCRLSDDIPSSSIPSFVRGIHEQRTSYPVQLY